MEFLYSVNVEYGSNVALLLVTLVFNLGNNKWTPFSDV